VGALVDRLGRRPLSASRAAPGDNVASELVAFGRFLVGLPRFLRERMSPAQAEAILVERLAHRERNFIALVRYGVVDNPRSPYRALMAEARCEFGDLEQMITDHGLEATLRQLHAAGVHLTFEEFKGRTPIVRNGREIPCTTEDFSNPTHRHYFEVGSGGSTGPSRRARMDLVAMRGRLPHRIMFRTFHGIADAPVARWQNIPPGNGLTHALMAIPGGERLEAWFTSSVGGADGTSARFLHATQLAVTVARMTGAKVQRPVFLPFDQAVRLARWAAARVGAEGVAVIRGPVSRLLRVAVAANEAGIDLRGVVLAGGGEPPTPAKVAMIRRTGARFIANYSFSEVGSVGCSCLRSDDPNDQHFLQDHLALIQSPRTVPGFAMEVAAFCFTTLLPTAGKVLINVESDDYGVVDQRPCGCPWERLGYPTHLRGIRSFAKLTGEGITLVGSDVERVLDEVLPARFGGSPLDYQLEETEDERGFTQVVLRIAPHLGDVDEDAAVRLMLDALRRIDAGGASAANAWAQAGTLRVRREAPHATARGKVMPLHSTRTAPTTIPPRDGPP
jgi:hypothetical protein